jgi:hypothetical protein
MPSWADLYLRLQNLEANERAKEAQDQERHSVRAAFERWCSAAETSTMEILYRNALSRAAVLEGRTGARITVECPSHPLSFTRSQETVRVLLLAFGAARVYVYSSRHGGASPYVHIATTRVSATRFPVLVSVPGCLLRRHTDGGIELVDLRDELRRSITFDAVVLRAFDLLIAGAERRRVGASAAAASPASHLGSAHSCRP